VHSPARKSSWIGVALVVMALCAIIVLAAGYVVAAPADPSLERVWNALADLPFRPAGAT